MTFSAAQFCLFISFQSETFSRYLFVGVDDELSPLLCSLSRGDFSVGDVGRDEAEQALLEDLRAIVHKVLLRGQLSQIFLLQRIDAV